MNLNIGHHVSIAKSNGSISTCIKDAIKYAKDYGVRTNTFQIFIAGPRTRKLNLSNEDIEELKLYLENPKSPTIIAHGTYTDFPWNGKPHAAYFIKKEVKLCSALGIKGLVIHLGKTPHSTVLNVLPSLIVKNANSLIYLETPAVKPENSKYETPEKLAQLFLSIRKTVDKNLNYFALCIDTAHLWSCGVDLSSYEAAEEWFGRLEKLSKIIPSNRILIHLNDSCEKIGSGKDKHEVMLKGKIWSAYEDCPQCSGLAAIFSYAIRNNVSVVFERKPELLANDYIAVKKILK